MFAIGSLNKEKEEPSLIFRPAPSSNKTTLSLYALGTLRADSINEFVTNEHLLIEYEHYERRIIVNTYGTLIVQPTNV